MQAKRIKQRKMEGFVGGFLVIFGLIFLIVGLLMAIPAFSNNDKKVFIEGTISQIESHGDDEYTVYVRYTIDQTEYEAILNGYSSSFYVGKTIKIYYQIDDYLKIGCRQLDYLFLIFPIIGGLIVLAGLIVLSYQFNKKRQKKKLMEQGEYVMAEIIGVKENIHYAVNNRHPAVIECQSMFPFQDQKITFKSENIWVDVAIIQQILEEYQIQTLRVFYTIQKKKQYYVEIDPILQRINQKNGAEL